MRRLDYSHRKATLEDISQIVAIDKSVNAAPWTKSAFVNELDQKFSHFWVITDNETDERVMAFVVFSLPDSCSYIQTIAVAENFHRQGIASHLLRTAINYMIREGAESLSLDVRESNESAIFFYQKIGFTVIHKKKAFYSDGEAAYTMNLNLKAEAAEDF